MKAAIGNLAGVTVGLFLIGALMVAQCDYQKSFGGVQQTASTEDAGSIASYPIGYQTVALK